MNAPVASHPIRTGVISTVLGAVVVAILAEIWPPVKNVIVLCWRLVQSIFGLLAADYQAPGWILVICCGIIIITIVRFALKIIRKTTASVPAHLSYTTDYFRGAKWRWDWFGDNISQLWCFCPSCDSELVYDDSSCNDILRRSEPRTDFICEHCGHTRVASVPGGPKRYALSAIEREIRRKIRTGEVHPIRES